MRIIDFDSEPILHLQKLKASKMKMAMEIANRKVTAFLLPY